MCATAMTSGTFSPRPTASRRCDHSEPNRWNPNGATATNHALQVVQVIGVVGPPFSDAPEETWVMVTSPQPCRQDLNIQTHNAGWPFDLGDPMAALGAEFCGMRWPKWLRKT